MKNITAKTLKKKFINFFTKKEHDSVINTSILEKDDPTLLFVSAGMVPYKMLFMDNTNIEYNNKVTIQKCIRLGGKKSDLNNIGKTNYHHSFFEMLGNFSFGKYFKQEAITYAWEFLTKILKISKKNLFVTVHTKDYESYNLWENVIKINKNKIIKKKYNFWEMGIQGPCGFCSEIFYNKEKPIEIWNLVFIEYYRTAEKTLITLKRKSIDTGMGLERLLLILQKKETTYETTLFSTVMKKIKLIGKNILKKRRVVYKLLDHLRCCVILIDEKIKPASTGKGYILRKLLRLLFEYGKKILPNYKLLLTLVADCLYDLKKSQTMITVTEQYIIKIIEAEHCCYEKSIKLAQKIIQKEISNNSLNGEQIFKLYETYGIKIDYIKQIAKKNNIVLNISDFKKILIINKKKNREITKEKHNNIYYNKTI